MRLGAIYNSVGFKLAAIGIVPVVLFIGLIVMVVIPTLREEIYHEKETMTREMVTVGLNVLERYYEMEQEGILNEDEAQEQAIQTIEAMTFGDNNQDYYWINDFHPKMIMHPFRPDLEGEDLTYYEDPDGLNLFVEFVRVCEEQGSGFVPYQWQYYDDTERIEPKLSYVAEFEPWEWIIGTGVYIHDIDEAVGATTNTVVFWVMGIIAVAAVIAFLIMRPVIRNVKDSTFFIVNFLSQG